MLQLTESRTALQLAVPAGALALAESTATTEGLLAYDPATTPPDLVPVLAALGTRRLGRAGQPDRLRDDELLPVVAACYQKAALNLGHGKAGLDKDVANVWAKETLSLLRERWHYLTQGEVEQVFRLGSLAQLTPPPGPAGQPTEEVIYLSPKSVAVWLRRYKYQVKPLAMVHARRVTPPSCELPAHHPVLAEWRIERLAALLALPAAELRALGYQQGDFKNFLFHWLRQLGVLHFRPKPPGFWQRLEALDRASLRRRGQLPAPEAWLQLATGAAEKFTDRLTAAKRWRTLRLWLGTQRRAGTDLRAWLLPLARELYTQFPLT